MTDRIWPRLPFGPARAIHETLSPTVPPDATNAHLQDRHAYFAPVGTRADGRVLSGVRDDLVAIARDHGFPERVDDATREAFDLEITRRIHDLLPMGWAEAGSAEVWNHVALVTLVDVTWWRWRHMTKLNIERFTATDMTRHTWARLWWRHTQIDGELWILEALGERNLNQFLERRESIGTSRELIRELATQLLGDRSAGRRIDQSLVRDVTKRALRQLAFVDDSALSPEQRERWTREMVEESRRALGAR